jgi:hypothetical protein
MFIIKALLGIVIYHMLQNTLPHTERLLHLPNKGTKGSGMQAFTITPYPPPPANCHSAAQ